MNQYSLLTRLKCFCNVRSLGSGSILDSCSVLIPIPQVLIPISQICVVGIRLGHNVVIWPYYAHHVGHRLKILWGKSQATVPAPGKKGGRELAPVPGLPEGRYDCVET